ncbi:glycosyltransferase family A protein [Flavobacterium tructae]|uniref:glycosyltransferase family 2 protein n=1 Tax=Flavobacterium tructae TaxID=1114873 RepID=UPI002552033B|nr:glycosyltransferase family A protein [Flavobacterium tructae]MDL2143332.1 glycosyltransferase family A protein [Flavobacterium tructae]
MLVENNLISVIIPVYNSEDTIDSCITSVLNQTYDGNIEIIVINDGSKDRSQEIVEEIIKSNNTKTKIRLINKINGGVSSARNLGLSLSKGNFIALLDSDDLWFKDKLKIQMPYLLDNMNEFDFVACNRNNEEISFPYKVINNTYATITLKKLLLKVVGQTSTAVFKAKILKNTGFFDENQKYSEDANFWMKISLKNKMIILNQSLVITGGGKPSIGFSGLSANIEGMEEGAQKNIKEMYDLGSINFLEFQLIHFFSKIKYYLRIAKYKKRS